MLDLQRQRSSSQSLAGTVFASRFVTAHLVFGPVAATLLIFHQLFFAALVFTGWFLCSICIAIGMMNHHQWCRILLAAWFIMGAIAGFVYLLYASGPSHRATTVNEMLPRAFLPFWMSSLVLAYLAGAFMLLLSRRITRATMRGFRLWDSPRD